MTGFAVVSTTVESREAADALARALVESRLAACVHITPVTSIYRWQGVLEAGTEMLLSCKIATKDFDEVAVAISRRHAYEVPEIVMTPIVAASPDYLGWLQQSLDGKTAAP